MLSVRRAPNHIREHHVHALAPAVQPVGALVNVFLQVLLAHLVINAVITALEQRPKRLNAVRVGVA